MMKGIRRTAVITVLLAMMLAMAACGNKSGEDVNKSDGEVVTSGNTDKSGTSEDRSDNGTHDISGNDGSNNTMNGLDASQNSEPVELSMAEYADRGFNAAPGTYIKSQQGYAELEVMEAKLSEKSIGYYQGYEDGNTDVEAVLFTSVNNEVVFKLKGNETDAVILFNNVAASDGSGYRYHYFGKVSGTFEGIACDGCTVLMETEDSWLYLYICSSDETLVDRYTLQSDFSESEFILGKEGWCGTYRTGEYSEVQVEIKVETDEYGLVTADITTPTYQGSVWCTKRSSNFFSETGDVIEYSSISYDVPCRYATIQFSMNAATGLAKEIYFSIIGDAVDVRDNAYKVKDYIAPAAFVNSDNAGVWGTIPVHTSDSQYFTPSTEDYIVEYKVGDSYVDNDYSVMVKVEQYMLYSYNELGRLINTKEKHVCPDAASAELLTAQMQEQLQYMLDGKTREIVTVDNVVYQYETDDIDYFPHLQYNDKYQLINDMEYGYFYGYHMLTVVDDYDNPIYYWISEIITEEEGRELTRRYNELFAPYKGYYYQEGKEKQFSNAVILYDDGQFRNSIQLPVTDSNGYETYVQTQHVQINEDGSFTAIAYIDEQLMTVAELKFNDDKTKVTGYYYTYACKEEWPSFSNYKDKTILSEGDYGEFIFTAEEY